VAETREGHEKGSVHVLGYIWLYEEPNVESRMAPHKRKNLYPLRFVALGFMPFSFL
jgi:hypothetical protein